MPSRRAFSRHSISNPPKMDVYDGGPWTEMDLEDLTAAVKFGCLPRTLHSACAHQECATHPTPGRRPLASYKLVDGEALRQH
jgi:hypothetical protein